MSIDTLNGFDDSDDFETEPRKLPPKEHIEFRADQLLGLLGQELTRIRKEKGIRQVDLARSVEVEQGYISKIENGECNPSWRMLFRLCESLQVSIPQLVLYVARDDIDETTRNAADVIAQTIDNLLRKQLVREPSVQHVLTPTDRPTLN